MKEYILDFENADYIIVSNDTFYFLKFDEQPLDDNSYKEIDEICKAYNNNFTISDDYQFLENGKVSIEIIPYKEDSFEYDLYTDLFNDWQVQFKWIDDKTAKVRYFNPYKEPKEEEIVEVVVNKFGLREFKTKGGSLYPLKCFKKA